MVVDVTLEDTEDLTAFRRLLFQTYTKWGKKVSEDEESERMGEGEKKDRRIERGKKVKFPDTPMHAFKYPICHIFKP